MKDFPINPLVVGVAAILVVVIVLAWRWFSKSTKTPQDPLSETSDATVAPETSDAIAAPAPTAVETPDSASVGTQYPDDVQQLINTRNYEEAAAVLIESDQKSVALDLLKRHKLYASASEVAELLDNYEEAAELAIKAKQFERAANLYLLIESFIKANALYKRAGMLRDAAEAISQSNDASSKTIAHAWEQACFEPLPSDLSNLSLTKDQAEEIIDCAEHAAKAYEKSGDINRATVFYNICQKKQVAQNLRARSSLISLNSMTAVPTDPRTTVSVSDTIDELAANISRAVREAIHGPEPTPTQESNPEVDVVETASSGLNILLNTSPSRDMNEPAVMIAPSISIDGENDSVVYVLDPFTHSETALPSNSERYSIQDKLGEGGMSVVYKAYDKALEREVALKFLPKAFTRNDEARSLFEREARAASSVAHVNIVTLLDFGVIGSRPYHATELLKGSSLESCLDEYEGEQVPLDEIFHVMEGVLSALESAHAKGVVHRDIKPSNIMVLDNGGVKLMDFGVASAIDTKHNAMVVGTPFYMAPEQFSDKPNDHRIDIFSVGVTLYVLLTGRFPFNSVEHAKPPVAPSSYRSAVSPELERLVGSCLSLKPSHRPQSCSAVLAELRNIRQQRPAPPPIENESFWEDAEGLPEMELGTSLDFDFEMSDPSNPEKEVMWSNDDEFTPTSLEELLQNKQNAAENAIDANVPLERGKAMPSDLQRAIHGYLHSSHRGVKTSKPRLGVYYHGPNASGDEEELEHDVDQMLRNYLVD